VPKARPKPRQPPPGPARAWWPDFWVCLLLLAATWAVYGNVRHFDFVNYDDPGQVNENDRARQGLSAESVKWALTSGEAGNWFPVTRLSYLIDVQLFGVDAGMLHLTNLALHACNTLLLFAFLRRATGARWRSALVAGLFALHPLNVQSVAWITERKGLLSACFGFAVLLAYVHYVRRPAVRRYLLVVTAFCLALMAKGVVVALPLALLLLDVWPLRRIPLDAKPKAAVLWEKAPLLVLSFASTLVGYLLQRRVGALASSDFLPLALRFGNAVVSYVVYILQIFRPTRLAVFYPYDMALPVWQVGAAAVVLLAVTFMALRWLRRRPWFAVGWFWYLGMLVPMIGLVQVGAPSHADRYTYLPAVGLWIMLAWSAAEVVERWPRARAAVAGLAVAGCAACLWLSWIQAQYWENSIALFRHALQVTSRNWLAYNNLGSALRSQGQTDEAIADFQRALALRSGYVGALTNLGEAYNAQGRFDEAARYSAAAVSLDPASADAHVNLGGALGALGRPGEAEAQFRQALQLRAADPKAHNDLGIALASQGKVSEALAEFAAAVRLKPEYANAQFNLGAALANSGRLQEALQHLSEALRLQPNDQAARRSLELVSARLRESGGQ
jgi:tetratricopeptide (TPR) repeat protein